MVTGRNSKVIRFSIGDGQIVQVQANKHWGICDVVLGVLNTDNKKKTIPVFSPIRRLSEILSMVQGRQANDPIVIEHIKNIL